MPDEVECHDCNEVFSTEKIDHDPIAVLTNLANSLKELRSAGTQDGALTDLQLNFDSYEHVIGFAITVMQEFFADEDECPDCQKENEGE